MEAAAWECARRLFLTCDRNMLGKLSLDELVRFVEELKKMEIISIDETYIVEKLQEGQLENITFEQFKEWSQGANSPTEKVNENIDPFGNSNVLPERFADATRHKSNVKTQHPCFTTTAHEIGFKRPQQVDMPVKWRGKEGVFTREFEMREPGKTGITVNTFVDRGLRTGKTKSKVHKELDVDF